MTREESGVCETCGEVIWFVGVSMDGVDQWEHEVGECDCDHFAEPAGRAGSVG